MSTFHAAFVSEHRQDTGNRDVSVLLNRFDTIRYDNFVALPARYDIGYSSGQAVCLLQYFDVIQSYRRGQESWQASFEAFYALGEALCLSQTYDIVQSYKQGAETWSCFFESFYARGNASCLSQTYDIVQPYTDGSESWRGGYDAFFSTGQSVGLIQTFDVELSFMQGAESWLAFHESVDGTLRKFIVALVYDVVQRDYHESIRSVHSTYVIHTAAAVGGYNQETDGLASPVFSIDSRHDTLAQQSTLVPVLFDGIQYDRVWSALSMTSQYFTYRLLLHTVTPTIILDTFSGMPREVDCRSQFDQCKHRHVSMIGWLYSPEISSCRLTGVYESRKAQEQLVLLQEEAIFEYSATLINVITSLEVTHTSFMPLDITRPLLPYCVGDATWEIELATTARYYDPKRPASYKEPVLWRFVTKDNQHWRQGPVVSNITVETLDSFFQLRFSANWPYQAIRLTVETFQLEPPQEGDFFDLGIWTGDSVVIDTEAPPVLAIPCSCDIRDYAVHVPRTPTTKFIAVAPIRRFPFEEIGAMTAIFIP